MWEKKTDLYLFTHNSTIKKNKQLIMLADYSPVEEDV